MEAVLDERLGDVEMEEVGRHDRHEVDAFIGRQGGFGLGHLLVRAVHAVVVEVQRAALLGRLVGVGGEGAGDEFGKAIQRGRAAVHGADEGARSAANHAVA